jgi:predicted PolB exonuclease-like 3'-5' exonuclease
MSNLYFDIETIPAGEESYSALQKIYDKKKLKNPDFKKSFEEFIDSTSLTGSFGQIACIGVASGDERATVLAGTEIEQLTAFWNLIRPGTLLIGHNVFDFDLPFLKQRSIILGIKPVDVSLRRYSNSVIFDTMQEWNCWSRADGWSSLDTLAHVLKLKTSKDNGIDGSLVAAYYKDGKIKEIQDYCKADVELTRKIYKKMTFTDATPTLPF